MEPLHLALFALSMCVVVLAAICVRLSRALAAARAREPELRRDAVRRSRATRSGHIAETFAPLLGSFGFPLSDARFLGHPIDYVVFDGLDEGELREVCFVEIKRGKGRLNDRQRQIRDAVLAGAVSWREVHIE